MEKMSKSIGREFDAKMVRDTQGWVVVLQAGPVIEQFPLDWLKDMPKSIIDAFSERLVVSQLKIEGYK